MNTLENIYKLIHDTNDEIFNLYEKYPTVNDLKNSEEYKILAAKVIAYEDVFQIVRNDLRELRKMVTEMADI